MGDSYILSRRAAWPTSADGQPVLDSAALTALAEQRVPTLDFDDLEHAIQMFGGETTEELTGEDDPKAAFLAGAVETLSQELVCLADEIKGRRLRLEFDGRRWWLNVHDLHHESGDYSELLRAVDLLDDCGIGLDPVDGDMFLDIAMTAAGMAAADTVVQVALSALRTSGVTEDQLAAATAALTKVTDTPVQLAATMRTAYTAAHQSWEKQCQNFEVVHAR